MCLSHFRVLVQEWIAENHTVQWTCVHDHTWLWLGKAVSRQSIDWRLLIDFNVFTCVNKCFKIKLQNITLGNVHFYYFFVIIFLTCSYFLMLLTFSMVYSYNFYVKWKYRSSHIEIVLDSIVCVCLFLFCLFLLFLVCSIRFLVLLWF